MNLTIDNILLVGSLLLLISVILGKTSFRFGVPTLLVFLGIGMLAGSEGIGGIEFDNPITAQFIGVISLNIILFSGGFDTQWKEVKPIMKEGLILSTVGVFLTAIILGLFIHFITDFSILESFLLSSIVSSTDAAAVFSILRSRNLGLRNNLRPTLELESGSNDPMAYVLTISFLSLLTSPEKTVLSIILNFFMQMGIGITFGFIFGRISQLLINKIKIGFDSLYPILVLSLMFITFSVSNMLNGNGFLSIYICALYLGNVKLSHKKIIAKMFDGFSWLVQIILFLTLGLLVFPSKIIPLIGVGLLISLFLIFVARPLSVFIGLSPIKMQMRRRIYVSWVGLRGAVPIVFATYPLIAGIEKADIIFSIVFVVSVSSLLIQGTTLSIFAKWLGLTLPEKIKKESPINTFFKNHPLAAMHEYLIEETCSSVGKPLSNLNMPENSIIAMILRDGRNIIPRGQIIIQANDTLVVLADSQDIFTEINDILRK